MEKRSRPVNIHILGVPVDRNKWRGDKEELTAKNFPELKKDVKTSCGEDAQSARGLMGAMEGQWMLLKGTITQEDITIMKDMHRKIGPQKKKKCRVTTDGL